MSPIDGKMIEGINGKIDQTDHTQNQDHQTRQLQSQYLPHLIRIGENMEDHIII